MIKYISFITAIITLVAALVGAFQNEKNDDTSNRDRAKQVNVESHDKSNVVVADNVTIKNSTTTIEQQEPWRKYKNIRFGFEISYPAEFMRTDEPDNGDGVYFISDTDKEILHVSASFDFDDWCNMDPACDVEIAPLKNIVMTNDNQKLVKSRDMNNETRQYQIKDSNIIYTITVPNWVYDSNKEIAKMIKSFKLVPGIEAKR